MSFGDESWRPVPGYEGRYEVSSIGRVRGLRLSSGALRQTPYVLKPQRSPAQERLGVTLANHRFTLHRLVAAAFLGPRPDGMTVNHKDGDKDNNRAENLEYVTPQQNVAHATALRLVRQGEAHRCAKLTADAVREIRRSYPGETLDALARRFGVSFVTVSDVVNHKTWRSVAEEVA